MSSQQNNNIDFSDLHLLVIGDVILDEFIYTSNHRMSPEYPVPVYAVETQEYFPGGAANVAANILTLGAQVDLLSVIGNDNSANILKELLQKFDCDTSNIIACPERNTTRKSRLFSGSEPIARIDNEITLPISESHVKTLLEKMKTILETRHVDGIILQDYNKGVLTPDFISTILEIATQKKIKVFVDPKIENYQAYSGSFLLKPNLNEITEILGYKPSIDLKSLDEAANKLKAYVDHDTLVLTLSDKGAYFSQSNESAIVSTVEIENPDVCGAGDSFIAAISLCLCKNMGLKESISLANKVSAVVCSKQGVRTCKFSEI